MKRSWLTRLTIGLMAVAMLLGGATEPLAQALRTSQGSYFWWLNVVDERGKPITSGVTCRVFTAGTDTAATLHSNATLTTVQTQPVSADSSGLCSWYHSTSTAVDVVVYHKKGFSRFNSWSINDHNAVIDTQTPAKVIRIPFTNSAGSKTRTGVTIHRGWAVHDVMIEVSTGAADAHIAVGVDAAVTDGDDDGFCGGGETKVADLATGGMAISGSTRWVRCHAVATTATHALLDFYYSAFHSGVLISRGRIGNDSHTGGAVPHAGSYTRFPYVPQRDREVVYTTNNKTVHGHIYLFVTAYH